MIETLIALLVIAMALSMLPGAIITAARINREVAEQKIMPSMTRSSNRQELLLEISSQDGTAPASREVTITGYQDAGYVYF